MINGRSEKLISVTLTAAEAAATASIMGALWPTIVNCCDLLTLDRQSIDHGRRTRSDFHLERAAGEEELLRDRDPNRWLFYFYQTHHRDDDLLIWVDSY